MLFKEKIQKIHFCTNILFLKFEKFLKLFGVIKKQAYMKSDFIIDRNHYWYQFCKRNSVSNAWKFLHKIFQLNFIGCETSEFFQFVLRFFHWTQISISDLQTNMFKDCRPIEFSETVFIWLLEQNSHIVL